MSTFKIKCPIESEKPLFDKLLGKTTEEAAELIAEEFMARFKPDCGFKYVLEKLSGCRTWPDLDLKIRNFTVLRRPEPVSDNQKRFWPLEAITAIEQLRVQREEELDF